MPTDRNTKHVILHRTNVGIVITAKGLPSAEECVRHEGVAHGSYAAELVSRFHHYLFGRARDLKEEYYSYYAEEYACVEAFLYHKYAIGARDIERLETALNSKEFVGLVSLSWGRDWQIHSLMDSDDGADIVLSALGATWEEELREGQI